MSTYQNNLETDKPTILIVDDERIARDILEGYLISEDYNLVFSTGGFQALEYLEKYPVDLVILDIMMAHMDGTQVCRHIKSNERLQNIPVILITGFSDDELQDRARDVGADGFLVKPIKGTNLRFVVRSMLDRAKK